MTKQPVAFESKPTKNLLDFILLQELDAQPMREQQIATCILSSYGIRLGVEVIGTCLEILKSRGLIENKTRPDFEFENQTPFQLTTRGRNALSEAEKVLISTCKEICR